MSSNDDINKLNEQLESLNLSSKTEKSEIIVDIKPVEKSETIIEKKEKKPKNHYIDIPINIKIVEKKFESTENQELVDILNSNFPSTFVFPKDLHVTVFFGLYGTVDEKNNYLFDGNKYIRIGKRVKITVIGYGLDEDAFVLYVDTDDTFNPIPHITVGLREGVSAKDSVFSLNNKDIWEKEKKLVVDNKRITKFEQPFILEGITKKHF